MSGGYDFGRGEAGLPYDAVEGCDAEEIPFGGDPAPKLGGLSAGGL